MRKAQTASVNDRSAAAVVEYPRVVENGRVKYVLVPVEDYERLADQRIVERAVQNLEDLDDKTKWVDADQFGRELAGMEIAAARKRAGLTQVELAAKLGIPQSQVSRIERNPDHTTVRTLKKVAKALGVRLGALVR